MINMHVYYLPRTSTSYASSFRLKVLLLLVLLLILLITIALLTIKARVTRYYDMITISLLLLYI